MKITTVLLSAFLTIGCASNTKQSTSKNTYKKTPITTIPGTNKGNFKACQNRGVIVALFAKNRDAGLFVPATKEFRVFDKIAEGNSSVADRILKIVTQYPKIKPDVLSSAYAIHCYSPALYSPYRAGYKSYAYCNKYSGNTIAVGKCVRRTAGVNIN